MKKSKTHTVGELVFGIHPIQELLKAKQRKLITLYTTKPTPRGWELIQKYITDSHVQIQYVSRDALHRMAQSTDHQGVVAYAQPFPYRKKIFDIIKQPFLALLDGIQDPRNVGAIIRSAYCTGVDGIVLCQKGSSPLTAVALKSSAGLAEHMPIFLASSAEQAAKDLKHAGYNLYLAAFNGQDARACTFVQPCCIVIGNEAVGITKSLYNYGTQVTLPQRTADISYNASVAAGLLLFLAASQQKRI